MRLKTNIKIDMSCTFKQEDTTEPRRGKARIQLTIFWGSTDGKMPQERGPAIKDTQVASSPPLPLLGKPTLGRVAA